MKKYLSLSLLFIVMGCATKPAPTTSTPATTANFEYKDEDISREPASPSPDISLMDKISTIQSELSENEPKALEDARNVLSAAELSTDEMIRKRQLHSVISLAVELLPKDNSGELDDYIHDFHRDYTTDFDQVLREINHESREVIEESLAQSQKIFDEGEEE